MKRFFTLSIFALTVMTALLFFFRLQAGSYLFTRILQGAGAKDIQLKLSDLNSNELIFSRVDCTINGNIVSMQGGSFRWSHAVLSKKRLDTVAIDTLVVQLAPKNQPPSTQSITLEQILTQIGQIRQQLPFQSLSVHHLTLTGPASGSFSGRELGFRLEKQGLKIMGELVLPERNLRLKMASPDENQWRISLDEPGRGDPFFSARLQHQEKQIRVKIEANLAGFNRLTPLLPGPLPEMKGKLTGRLAFSVNETTADLALNIQQTECAGTAAASVKLALHGRIGAAGKLHVDDHSVLTISGLQKKNMSIGELTVGLDGVLEQVDGQQRFKVSPEATVKASHLKGPGLAIESVTVSSAMQFISSGKKIALILQPDWRMRIIDLMSNGVHMAEAELQPEHETILSIVPGKIPVWSVAPSSWQWTMNPVTQQQIRIDSAPISINILQLTGTAEKQHIQMKLSSRHLDLTNNNTSLSLADIKATLGVESGRITGKASLSPKYVPGTLKIKFSHDVQKGRGTAIVQAEEPVSFSKITPLSSVLNQWPFAFDLTDGQLRLNGSIHWQQKQPVQASLQLELSGAKGNLKEVLFSGLAIREDLQLLPTIQSVKNGFVTIDSLETGITVKNIAMETGFSPSPHGRLPILIVRNLSASLFGGTASDDFFSYDPQQPEVESTIRLNNIDLARMITVQQVKGLKVTGHIKGSLPFILDKTGLRMDEGILHNTAGGGLIRYTLAGNAGLKESPLTEYALKALEEFHYSLLSATAEYQPDGDLHVSLHLEGKSPKLDTKRPVHLNINTEQNLLSLLKSLRYSSSLTGEIDKEVRQHYQE